MKYRFFKIILRFKIVNFILVIGVSGRGDNPSPPLPLNIQCTYYILSGGFGEQFMNNVYTFRDQIYAAARPISSLTAYISRVSRLLGICIMHRSLLGGKRSLLYSLGKPQKRYLLSGQRIVSFE